MQWPIALVLLSVPAALSAGADVSFPAASICSFCHSRIPPPADEHPPSVAPFALWRGSMMAHASSDPFWKAKVQEEAALTPVAKAAIEDKCLRCHAPTQQYAVRAAGMALRELKPGGDGVSCAVCHQISRVNLGSPASFTGGFEINRDSAIYGPHKDPFRMPMEHHTGLTPTEAAHVLESSLCGTCHTVTTPTLAPDGRITGQFLEQATYLEWLASEYSKSGTTCQKCHVPVLRDRSGAPAAQYIAHMPPGRWFPPTSPRRPFGLHFFAGGNSPMLNLLADSAAENQAALRQIAEKASENLRAAVGLTMSAVVEDRVLRITVEVRNRTGHKLPTGFPSRRIWLHLEVFSTAGTLLFESGAWDRGSGAIRGGAGLEPHRSFISQPEQVMIYQAVAGDAGSRPTTTLLRAASYLKDNRILPAGFDRVRDPRVAPVGVSQDSAFRPGSHRVRYDIVLPRGVSPARFRVEALYQSIAPAYVPTAQFDALSPAMLPVSMTSTEMSLTPAK